MTKVIQEPLSGARKKGFAAWINEESTAGVVFSLPFIVGFLMFMLIPMGLSLYYSFCKYDIQTPPSWIGVANYVRIFTNDRTFKKTLGVTCYFALIGTPLKVIFALIVALILNHETKAVPFYRATYYLPSIIGGSVAVAILWRRMFESNGTLNAILSPIFPGLAGYNWFKEGPAIWVLIILTVWQFGSSMLIFLSSLKQIPRELYEAATVDGANKWQQFRNITLPQLSPTTFFVSVMLIIGCFKVYDTVALMTGGGPGRATKMLVTYTIDEFNAFKYGSACAIAMVLLVLVLTVTLIQFRMEKKFSAD